MKRLLIITVLFLSLIGPRLAQADVLVHAAASLTDALQEIASMYQQEGNPKVQFNFGASSTLARQIQEGAPGDIFFSAEEEEMNSLEKKGLIVKDTRRSLLSNTLVIVVPADSKIEMKTIQDLTKAKNIAIAEPQSVPAGIYAKEYLRKVGLWGKLIDRMIPAENVRATLAVVEAGNADAGIVYKTDALISKRVRTALEIPRAEGPKITYSVAVLKESMDQQAAMNFYRYMISDKALEVYRKYGFLMPE